MNASLERSLTTRERWFSLLGGAYLLSRRNLRVSILAHGCADTIAIVAVFLGLAD